jgi:hypothetical protein
MLNTPCLRVSVDLVCRSLPLCAWSMPAKGTRCISFLYRVWLFLCKFETLQPFIDRIYEVVRPFQPTL